MKTARVWLFVLIASIALGCSGSSVVGKYKAHMDLSEKDKANPMAGLAEGMMSSMTLELKGDKTFAMTMIFPIEGTYSQSGDTLTLTPTKVMGMSMDEARKQSGGGNANAEKPMVLKVADGGKTLLPVGEGSTPSGMKFVRE